MKKLISVLLSFVITTLLFTSLSAQKDDAGFATYQSVVERFMATYSIASYQGNSQFRFEKRPEGWYAVVVEYSLEQRVLKKELYWDSKKNVFNEVDFPKLSDISEGRSSADAFLNDWNRANFEISPYFGYPGWDRDVITHYADKKNLSDTLLYALGRAYSSYASNLLNNNSGLADREQMFVLADGKNSLSPAQLEEYRKYRHAGIEKFKELAKRNPAFETIVGTIGLKTANEHLTSFLDLRMYQNETEAMKELPENLYNEFVIAMAKNYLQPCPPHSILFTNGDNDTYPLLYVQARYGYRPDVLVVNLSLLQTDRYINMLREKILQAEPLPVTFSTDQLKGNSRDVIIVMPSSMNGVETGAMALDEVIAFLKDENNQIPYGAVNYYYIPTGNFYMLDGENRIDISLDARYFLRNQLIFYDVLASVKFTRPLCFAITVGDSYFFGMQDYLQLLGMVYVVRSEKKENSDYGLGSVDTRTMYDHLTKHFDKAGLDRVKDYEKLPAMNYRNIFYRLADALIQEGKNDSAKTILDLGVALIPDETLYIDVYMIPFADYYFRIGEEKKGLSVAIRVAENIKNNRDNYSGMSNYRRSDSNEMALKMLKELAERYGQKDLLKKLE